MQSSNAIRGRSRTARVLLLTLLVALVAFFHVRPEASRPLRRVTDIFLSQFTGYLSRESVDVLEVQIREQDRRIQELREENEALKRSQAIVGTTSLNRALTRVLWYDPDAARSALHIAVPTNLSFKIGETVVAPGDILIGKITATFGRSAEVLLIDDPEFTVSVVIGKITGRGVGNGAGGLNVTFVPAEDAPKGGSAVYTAGKEGMIPEGLLLGSLVVDTALPSDPFASLKVAPATPLDGLRIVSVLLTGAP